MFGKTVELAIRGLGDKHEAIEALLRRPPTYSHRRGEPTGEGADVSQHDIWALESPLPFEAEFTEHLHYFCNLLTDFEEAFRSLKADGGILTITFSMLTNERVFGFALNHPELQVLAKSGVHVAMFITHAGPKEDQEG
jgi:hypothetical protein